MLGILCVDLDDKAVDHLKEKTGAVVLMSPKPKKSSTRRFIYLADLVREAVMASAEKFVVVRTNWIRELADSKNEYIGGARAIDRVMLRFGAINVVTPTVFHAACTKMVTLQVPRNDIVILGRESAQDLITLAERRRMAQAKFALSPTMTNLSGSVTEAKTLLVGDQIHRYLPFDHWPFFDDWGSAQFISGELEKGNIVESTLAWTNSTHETECFIVKEVLIRKPSIKVIALGNVAHEKLSKIGVSHLRMAHPQYARRFDHHGDYAVVLEQAIRG